MQALITPTSSPDAESAVDIDHLFGRVLEHACELTGCDDASIVLWDRQQDAFIEGGSTNVGGQIVRRVRKEGGATRWIVENARPLIVNAGEDNDFTANPIIKQHNVKSFAGVPIIFDGEVLGVLYVLCQVGQRFDPAHLRQVEMLADMAAISIVNGRLAQSRQALLDFKDILIQVVAHDIRSPLGRVRGFLELLIGELPPLDAEHLSWVAAIGRGLDQMEDLTNTILSLERLNSSTVLELHPCELNTIVQTAVSTFRSDARAKGQALNIQPESGPLLIRGDAHLLQEAMANLIGNAIKYTPNGGLITVRSWRGGDAVYVAVQDNGPGIGETEQADVFKPFVRLKSALGHSGSGLGLSLVKTIVNWHEGAITLDSTIGIGTTFTIRLPAHQY